MRKFTAMLLALILMTALPPAAAAAETPKAVSVSISASESYTAPVSSDSPDTTESFLTLFKSAKKSSVKEADLKKLAYVTLEFEDSSRQVYTVYKSDGGAVYAGSGKTISQIGADSFYRLADSLSINFYKLRAIPSATVSSGRLAVISSGYSFKKLDGKFYKTQYTKGSVPVFEPVNGSLPVPEFSTKPESVRVEVLRNGDTTPEWSGSLTGFAGYKPDSSGSYSVRFKAAYSQPHARGEVTYEYSVKTDLSLSFSIDGANTVPGEIVVLRAKNVPEGASVTASTDVGFTPQFFRERSGDMVALMPVSCYTAPGQHTVTVKCGDTTQKFGITANQKQFVVQNLTVPPSTAQETINSQKANDEYEKYIAPLRKAADSDQYWDGRFIWPLKVERRVTTLFGTTRYTNGSKTPSIHAAIDLAAPAGTPVYASGAGRVAYSGYLQLTGNTIVIEHGYGLKTWYYHMNSRNVKTGDMVIQGQKIGEVGSTGFSTGAHLHFGMSVGSPLSGQYFVNPETAINTDIVASLSKNAS